MPQVPLGDVEKHFWLTRSVARCLNISLSDAMAEGKLSADRYAELVTRCRAANCSADCQIWLAAQQTRATKAPAFCANAKAFHELI